MSKERLARRIISSALQKAGWLVTTEVSGNVVIRIPAGRLAEAHAVAEELKEQVTALGYAPAVARRGQAHLILTTPETLAQSGRGAHR